MKVKQSLEKRILGWFPQEPKLPSKNSQPQARQENTPFLKRKISGPWLITYFFVCFFYLYFFNSQFSTLTAILIGITAALGLTWLLLSIRYNNRVVKTFNYALIAVVIFFLAFNSAGIYFSHFSGPIVSQVNYPNVLDITLTSQLQKLEQSPSFRFLQAAHFGTLTFQDLSIVTSYSNAPGGLDWTYYAGDIQSKVSIGQSGGQPYYYGSTNIFRTYSLAENYPSNQAIAESFNQIDSLGLHWFYDKAIEEYQKVAGTKPEITDLRLAIAYNDVGYHGITLLIEGVKTGQDNLGNKIYLTVFSEEFQSNGNELSARTNLGV